MKTVFVSLSDAIPESSNSPVSADVPCHMAMFHCMSCLCCIKCRDKSLNG